jgi:hypothetical protein
MLLGFRHVALLVKHVHMTAYDGDYVEYSSSIPRIWLQFVAICCSDCTKLCPSDTMLGVLPLNP